MSVPAKSPTESNVSRFSPEIIDALFRPDHDIHNQLWEGILPSEAALIRRAIVRAQEIRVSQADPGDAYLQGIAIILAADRQQQDLDTELNNTTDKYPHVQLVASDELGDAA